MLTGEPLPVHKGPGDCVVGATINQARSTRSPSTRLVCVVVERRDVDGRRAIHLARAPSGTKSTYVGSETNGTYSFFVDYQ
jgi:hypothetical protein